MPGVLGKLNNDAEDLVVDLHVRGQTESCTVLSEKIEILATFLIKVRTCISEYGSKKKEDLKEEWIQQLEEVIQQGLAHRTGMQEYIQAARARRAATVASS